LKGRGRSGGEQTVSPGNFEIKVAAENISGEELFRLRRLELKPVGKEWFSHAVQCAVATLNKRSMDAAYGCS